MLGMESTPPLIEGIKQSQCLPSQRSTNVTANGVLECGPRNGDPGYLLLFSPKAGTANNFLRFCSHLRILGMSSEYTCLSRLLTEVQKVLTRLALCVERKSISLSLSLSLSPLLSPSFYTLPPLPVTQKPLSQRGNPPVVTRRAKE